MAKTLLGRVLAPHTPGASEAWLGILACMRWPVPVTYLAHRIMVRGAPRSSWSVRRTTRRPTTCDERRAAHRGGDGHTLSWLQNSRTSDAIAHYLITRQTPPPNTVYPD